MPPFGARGAHGPSAGGWAAGAGEVALPTEPNGDAEGGAEGGGGQVVPSDGALGGAGDGPDGGAGVGAEPGADAQPYGFSWVLDGRLAGLAYPGHTHGLATELDWMAAQGVRLLVSLTGAPPDPTLVADAGLDSLHLPVVDFQPPSPEQVDAFVAAVDAALLADDAVAVHCAAGRGRTGTMLAMYFVHRGLDGAAAIEHVRALRPGSIETQGQEQAILAYSAAVHGAP